jgi:uncharacterized protein YbjQ (UPF0145 family)
MSWFVTCSQCGKSVVYESGQKIPELCPACAETVKKEAKRFLEKEERRKEMIAVGVPEIQERRIVKTLGLVCDEQIFGMGLPNDATLEKFNGGIALTWAERVRRARETSIRSILAEAIEKGGNGVVGISLTYEVLGYEQDMVMVLVAARGTAVVVEQ